MLADSRSTNKMRVVDADLLYRDLIGVRSLRVHED